MPDIESVMQALKDSLENQHCGFIEDVGNVYAVSEETINDTLKLLKEQEDLGTELTNAIELIHKKNERIKKLEEQIETLTKWRMNAGAFD